MPLEEDKKLTKDELRQILYKYAYAYHYECVSDDYLSKSSVGYRKDQEEILDKLWERIQSGN